MRRIIGLVFAVPMHPVLFFSRVYALFFKRHVVYSSVGLFLLGMMNISCKPKIDFSAELKATDSLKTELQTLTAKFRKIDSVRAENADRTIGSYLGFITQNLKDTISRNEALLLADFKRIKKSFGKYNKTRKDLARNYSFNLKQLENLQADMKEGFADNVDTVRKYIAEETEANRELLRIMKMHNEIIPGEIARFDSLKPLVEDMIKKITGGAIPAELLNLTEKKTNEEDSEEDD